MLVNIVSIHSFCHSPIQQIHIYCLQRARHHARRGDTVISNADTVSVSGSRWCTEEYREPFTPLGAEMEGDIFHHPRSRSSSPILHFCFKIKLYPWWNTAGPSSSRNMGPQNHQKEIVQFYISQSQDDSKLNDGDGPGRAGTQAFLLHFSGSQLWVSCELDQEHMWLLPNKH